MLLMDLSMVLVVLGNPRLLMVSELHRDMLGQVCRDKVEQGLDLRLLL